MLPESYCDKAACRQVVKGLKVNWPSLIAESNPPELAEAGQRSFHDVAELSQAAAVRVVVARSQEAGDTHHQHKSDHRHRAVSAIAIDRAGFSAWSSRRSLNCGYRLEQK